VLLVAGTARAQEKKPIQVVAIHIDDAFEQAQALTVALKNAIEKDARWELQNGDYSLEVMVTALDCKMPPETACLGKIATKVGAERFVWGTMKKNGTDVVAALNYWDKGGQGAGTALRYSVNINDSADEKLGELASGALRDLVGAAQGSLIVLAGNVDGEVWVDGHRAGKVRSGRAELAVTVGEHQVEVRARGYTAASSAVTVTAGLPAEVELTPTAAAADLAPPPEREASSGSQRTYGWVAIAAGGALAVGGVYSVLRVNSISEDVVFEGYRNGLRSDQDACDEAKRGTRVPGAAAPRDVADLCSEAQTFEVLQYVLFGLAGASIGTGAVLLLTDSGPSEERPAVSVRPRLAPQKRAAMLDVALAF
jgi:hypothetical protein